MWKPIISIVITIASIFFLVTYVIPEYRSVQELRGNILVLDRISDETKTIKNLLEDTAIVLEEIPKESDDRFSLLIPESVDHLRFANMLKTMALGRGIVLKDIKVNKEDNLLVGGARGKKDEEGFLLNLKNTIALEPGKSTSGNTQSGPGSIPGTKEKYTTTKGSLVFTATYPAFLSFLEDIERSLTLIKVTELVFSPKKEDSKKSSLPLYDYQIQVETYSIK